jgi:hypothetical protein
MIRLLLLGLELAIPIAVLITGARPAEASHTAYALIVTNNHGGALGRPDLQYADDDGARYYELFATLAPADHITLLTEFDRDSARLFPELVGVARPPSRANVAAAARAIAGQIAAAIRTGDTAEFYFVFAGHGDVDHGRGFLQLTDATFDAGDLEQLVRSIQATHSHVILDSCNSFFVANPRSPGGRRFATPADASAGLAQRVPNVGVFVSTSAEAEVFEWSALQSGVFSHAVRSGLAGAADANHDGVVSYDELRAFVDTATAEIKNSAFRPKVYARGPGGDDRTALVTAAETGPRLTLDAARAIRLTIRDRDELPWIDLNKEAGAPITLRLPASAASADELGDGGVIQRHQLQLEPGTHAPTLALAGLSPAAPPPAARAADAPFHALFARPFGPTALAQYDAERAAEPPPVFGISRDDATRLALLLDEADDEQVERRKVGAGLSVAVGASEIVVAGFARSWSPAFRLGFATAGVSGIAYYGLADYLRRPDSEHLRDALVHGLASGRDPGQVVAEVDTQLHRLASSAHERRIEGRWLGAITVAVAGGLYLTDRALDYKFSKDNSWFDPTIAFTAALGWHSLSNSFIESPIERTVEMWDHEHTLAGVPRFAVTPVPGGAMLSLSVRL